jgi:hypothetical protein
MEMDQESDMSKPVSKKATSKAGAAFEAIGRKSAPHASTPASIADQVGKRSGGEHTAGRTGVQIRFTRPQWRAVHALALNENVSVQGLVIHALDKIFQERGQPFAALKDNAASSSEAFGSTASSSHGTKR